MKYSLLPKLMWSVFKGSFERELKNTLHQENAKKIVKNAHLKYKEILSDVNEFDKGDRFIINILSCAMLASFILSLPTKPTLSEVRDFYRLSMVENTIMKKAMKNGRSYTKKGREKIKNHALASQHNENPYSWKFEVKDGKTINEYKSIFHTCGILYLMRKLSLEEYVPALCALDYDMAKMNNTEFYREYTLASGGPYCDCSYKYLGKK